MERIFVTFGFLFSSISLVMLNEKKHSGVISSGDEKPCSPFATGT